MRDMTTRRRHCGSGPKRIRRASLGLGGTLALLVVAGAFAAVPGWERVTAMSTTDDFGKRVTVTCPAGKKVLGAGGEVVPAATRLHQVTPNARLTNVRVQAFPGQGHTGGIWRADAHAICATPPPGLQRTLVESAFDSSMNKSAEAVCPAGKRVLGGAGAVIGAKGQVFLNEVIPGPSLSGVIVRAVEDQDGTSQSWSVVAFAICADPLPGLERVIATGGVNSTEVDAVCPPGKVGLGGGGDVTGGADQVALRALTPMGPPIFTQHGFRAGASRDDDGVPETWSLRAFAICADA